MEEYKELIVRYLSNNTSPAENQQLLEWVKYSPDNREYFINYCNTWNNVGLLDVESRYKKDVAFKKFVSEINKDISKKHPKEISLVVEHASKSSKLYYLIGAVAAVFIAVIGILFLHQGNDSLNNIVAANTEAKTITLDDGTVVKLSSKTTIEYADEFNENRHIAIKGKAFFEVAKDSLHPFVIEAGVSKIQVLGTSFEVTTFEDSTVVKVNTGRVRVADISGNDFVDITIGQIAVCNGSLNMINTRNNSDVNYFSKETGLLVFDNSEMCQVAKDLERHYEQRFSFEDESLEKCKLSAKYDNMKLEDVQQLLEATFGLKIKKINGIYVISGRGC